MRPELNPYAPGSGLRPPALVGRQAEIDAFDLLIARSRLDLHTRGLMLHGLRGVGKTVLLNEFRVQAERAGWLVVDFEGQPTATGRMVVRRKLGREIALAARRLQQQPVSPSGHQALATVSSFSATHGGSGFEVATPADTSRANSGFLEVDLLELVEDLVPALRERHIALGLFVDEMQDLDAELIAALVAVQHRAGQRQWPFYITGAGLPNLPALLTGARSYGERLFDYRDVGPLDEEAAGQALSEPAQRLGASYDADAERTLVDGSGGFPYYLQTYGQAAWNLSIDRRITIVDARAALERGNEQLDAGFFPAKWDRATPTERQYLRAMALDGTQASSTTELATRLQTRPQTLSPVRASLIAKGILFSPARGLVAFTLPAMDAFIRRQDPM